MERLQLGPTRAVLISGLAGINGRRAVGRHVQLTEIDRTSENHHLGLISGHTAFDERRLKKTQGLENGVFLHLAAIVFAELALGISMPCEYFKTRFEAVEERSSTAEEVGMEQR